MSLAPVVLFVYNRPWHTQQTLKALRENDLSEQSELIIFSDGPKSEVSQKPVQAVRDYIKNVEGFKSTRIFEQKTNKGLANSIISGVTDIVNKYGKIIVIEDDIITSPHFLKYMNDALDYYIDKPQVMHIAGYIPPINPIGLPQTFLIRPTSCWGWGTWKRAWDKFDKNPEKILRKFTPVSKKRFNVNNSYNFFSHITDNHEGKIDTWAIFWYVSVFFSNGLSLHPAQSLAKNIGHDSSGTHCKNNSQYNVPLLESPIVSFADILQEHPLATKKMAAFYKSLKQPFYKRISQQTKRLMGKG